MLITKKEVTKQYGNLNHLQKQAVSKAVIDIATNSLMTQEMKTVIAGLILFTDLAKYDG